MKKKRKVVLNWCKNYSRIETLLRDGLINKNFLSTMDNLQIEDLVAIKLELAVKAAGGYLYGLPIIQNTYSMVSEGVLKYALSVANTKTEASRIIGGDVANLNKKLKQFNLVEEVEKNS